VLPLQHHQCRGQLRLPPQIQDEHVRLPCGWLPERRQLAAGDRRAMHPTCPENVFELAIGRTYEQYV
jgi:hypothetical protein